MSDKAKLGISVSVSTAQAEQKLQQSVERMSKNRVKVNVSRQATQNLDQLSSKIQNIAPPGAAGALGKIQGLIGGLGGSALLAVTAVAALAGSFALVVKSLVAYGAATARAYLETRNLAAQAGVTVEALEGMQFAAHASGLSSEDLVMATNALSRRLEEAVQGSQRLRDAFRGLGLSEQALMRLTPERALARVADAMSRLEDGNKRAYISQVLFEDSGRKLMTVMDGQGRSLSDLIDQGERYAVTSQKQIEIGEKLAQKQAMLDAKYALLTDSAGEFATAFTEAWMRVKDGAINMADDTIGAVTRTQTALDKAQNKSLAAGNASVYMPTLKEYVKAAEDGAENVKELREKAFREMRSATNFDVSSQDVKNEMQAIFFAADKAAQDAIKAREEEQKSLEATERKVAALKNEYIAAQEAMLTWRANTANPTMNQDIEREKKRIAELKGQLKALGGNAAVSAADDEWSMREAAIKDERRLEDEKNKNAENRRKRAAETAAAARKAAEEQRKAAEEQRKADEAAAKAKAEAEKRAADEEKKRREDIEKAKDDALQRRQQAEKSHTERIRELQEQIAHGLNAGRIDGGRATFAGGQLGTTVGSQQGAIDVLGKDFKESARYMKEVSQHTADLKRIAEETKRKISAIGELG